MYGASGSTESILKGPRRRRKAHGKRHVRHTYIAHTDG
jgi:hypothetical protein